VETAEIECATLADFAACLPLLSELHKGDIGETMSGCFAEFCTTANAVVLIARRGGEIVGLVAGTEAPDLDFEAHVAVINAIVVAAGYRGRGIGRALVDAFIAWAQQRGCAAVLCSTTRQNAAQFVRALGFQPRGHWAAFVKYPVSPDRLGKREAQEQRE